VHTDLGSTWSQTAAFSGAVDSLIYAHGACDFLEAGKEQTTLPTSSQFLDAFDAIERNLLEILVSEKCVYFSSWSKGPRGPPRRTYSTLALPGNSEISALHRRRTIAGRSYRGLEPIDGREAREDTL
jgi:hypothetical protein